VEAAGSFQAAEEAEVALPDRRPAVEALAAVAVAAVAVAVAATFHLP
jgi:hypothetical protein